MQEGDRITANPTETARRQRRTILWSARLTFLALVFTVTLLTVLELSRTAVAEPEILGVHIPWWLLPVSFSALVSASALALDILTPSKKLATLSAIFFGLLAGLLATVAISFIIDLVAQAYGLDLRSSSFHVVAMTKVVLGIALCFLSITIVLGTQDDFRLVIPYVEFARQVRGIRPLILDSSVLIDGRILEASQTGFIQAPIIVPRFVVDELQRLADSSDRHKRQRGRRGLDMVNKMHASATVNLTVDETQIDGGIGVDQSLLELARQRHGVVVSTDIGLIKVGRIRQIDVINLNDLANALKLNLLPGMQFEIELIRRGENQGQAVGFLEDGTMVVVDEAAELIGASAQVEVTSSLQTSAGRMIFAALPGGPAAAPIPAEELPEAAEDEPAPPTPAASSPEPTAAADESEPRGAEPKAGPLGPGYHAKRKSRSLRNPRRE